MKARVYVIQFTKFAIRSNGRFDSQALAPINISDNKYVYHLYIEHRTLSWKTEFAVTIQKKTRVI